MERSEGVRVLASGWAARTLAWPWISLRAPGALGWAESILVGGPAAGRVGIADTGGLRGSVGGGFGLLYDLIRVDVARGLGSDGPGDPVQPDWTVFFSINPLFWDVL